MWNPHIGGWITDYVRAVNNQPNSVRISDCHIKFVWASYFELHKKFESFEFTSFSRWIPTLAPRVCWSCSRQTRLITTTPWNWKWPLTRLTNWSLGCFQPKKIHENQLLLFKGAWRTTIVLKYNLVKKLKKSKGANLLYNGIHLPILTKFLV